MPHPALSAALRAGGTACSISSNTQQQLHVSRNVQSRRRCSSWPARCQQREKQQQSGDDVETPNPGLGLKAVWMGAEQFGNLLGLAKGKAGSSGSSSSSSSTSSSSSSLGNNPAMKREEAVALIREDYDVNYFVSGMGDMRAYADDCLFADPFAGFKGKDRFKRNVSNLGGLMEDIQLELTDWREEDGELQTKWRFKGVLTLPWRPVLAAAGGTTHVFDERTGLVVKHIESWDVEPGKVVKSLLRPSAKVPTNQWEVLMAAIYSGDGRTIWYSLSPWVLKVALVAGGVHLAAKLALGQGLPGAGDALLVGIVAGCLATEASKLMTGGPQ